MNKSNIFDIDDYINQLFNRLSILDSDNKSLNIQLKKKDEQINILLEKQKSIMQLYWLVLTAILLSFFSIGYYIGVNSPF
jgi:flagellar capping protein FliD